MGAGSVVGLIQEQEGEPHEGEQPECGVLAVPDLGLPHEEPFPAHGHEREIPLDEARREPGRREARFAHLFSGDAAAIAAAAGSAIPAAGAVAPPEANGTGPSLPQARLTALELQVQDLREELRSLRERLGG